MCYVAYYALDLFIGRLKLRRMRAQWNLIIFDRSFYDYYFQLGYGKCPRWFLNLLGILVPKPDLAIFLDRDAREIYESKPELTVEEIERQQDAIRKFLSRKQFGCVINARAGVEATSDEVAREIMEALFRRLR